MEEGGEEEEESGDGEGGLKRDTKMGLLRGKMGDCFGLKRWCW